MGRRVAVLGWVATVVMAVVSLAFLARVPPRTVPGDLFAGVSGVAAVLMSLTFTMVGTVVVAKVPGNRIGWLLWLIGTQSAASTVTYQYSMYGLYSAPEGLPGSQTVAWISGFSAAQAPMLGAALLLFPDGHLPSRRWRPAAAIAWLSIAFLLLGYLFRPGPLDDPFGAVSNPTAIPGSTGVMNGMIGIGWILTVATMALGAASMALDTPRGAWVAVYFYSFIAVLVFACAIPHRRPPSDESLRWARTSPSPLN